MLNKSLSLYKTVAMKTKESVKRKIDQLDKIELRVVDVLLDSIRKRRKKPIKKPHPIVPPYEEVIKHLGDANIGSSDIIQGRQERL